MDTASITVRAWDFSERGGVRPPDLQIEKHTHTHILCGPRYGTHPHGSQKQETQKNCRKMIFREKILPDISAPEPEERQGEITGQANYADLINPVGEIGTFRDLTYWDYH